MAREVPTELVTDISTGERYYTGSRPHKIMGLVLFGMISCFACGAILTVGQYLYSLAR